MREVCVASEISAASDGVAYAEESWHDDSKNDAMTAVYGGENDVRR